MRSTIEMAREAGMYQSEFGWTTGDDPQCLYPECVYTENLKRLVELVRADEREAVIGFLRGINETETESEDGWWETSTGAEFGARILAAIRARGETNE
jgi:hypothetical protein